MKSVQWKKKGNVACNLSINSDVAEAVDSTIATKKKKRKGVKNRSELTERLWVAWLRRNGVKLPETCAALFKNGRGVATIILLCTVMFAGGQTVDCPSSNAHATPTPTLRPSWPDYYANAPKDGMVWSNPKDYFISDPQLTLRTHYEPVVKKNGSGEWVITFKP